MHRVIVFGKGHGESILFSIGANKFILIDSFLDEKTKKPIAIEYLESKGLSVNNICGIICTHWDDDHTKGIADIIKNLNKGTIFYCSKIFLKENFIRYISFLKQTLEQDGSEFSKILELIGQKKAVFNELICDRLLFNDIVDKNIQIRALSPNDLQTTAYLDALCIPKTGSSKNMNIFSNNNISAVILLKVENDYILFGADFEDSSLNNWDCIASKIKDFEKSIIFKVPHHGSESSYSKRAWKKMTNSPMSAITRFNRKMLPQDDMIKKVKEISSSVYIIGRKNKKNGELKKEIKKFLPDAKIYSFVPSSGYVEFEKRGNKWVPTTFGEVEVINKK